MATHATRLRMRGGHLPTRRCQTLKVGHATRLEALEAAERMMAAGHVSPGCHVMPYRCEACGQWHTRNQRIVFTEAPEDFARADYRRRRKAADA